jgi:hypothetical protein
LQYKASGLVGEAGCQFAAGGVEDADVRTRDRAAGLIDDGTRDVGSGGEGSAGQTDSSQEYERMTNGHVGSFRRLSRRGMDAPGMARFPDSRISAARLVFPVTFARRFATSFGAQ